MSTKSTKLSPMGLFTAGVLLAGASQSHASPNPSTSPSTYTFTLLGTLPDGANSRATAINNTGQVVGYSFYYGGNPHAPHAPHAPTHAILWKGSTATKLGTLPGETGVVASAINNAGQIVGSSYNGSYRHATLWNRSIATDLGALPGETYSEASGINDAGQVVGYSSDIYTRATLWNRWNRSTATDLGTLPGGAYSQAMAINNTGQVVGYSNNDIYGGTHHATLWNRSTATDLGMLPSGTNSYATAINNTGQVVGYSTTTLLGNVSHDHATLWNGSTSRGFRQSHITDLGTLPGGTDSKANAINDIGQVVGSSNNAIYGTTHATLWNGTGTTAIDLNNVSTARRGWDLVSANGINDKGWIVGNAYDPVSGRSNAFLLIPVVPKKR